MSQFRAKARAIELLGKGQIADLPTAISELWKNGYDAYGDSFGCDLFLKQYLNLKSPIFTLWDDGIGMSKEDIINKWLVLGTDSKIRGDEPLTKEERLGKPIRIKMGEKGIGRLSVSYLGSQMLLLTKKQFSPCVAVFLNWDILQNYNLYLDDFSIPIKTFKNKEKIFDVFDELKIEFLENLKNKSADWSEHDKLKKEIAKSVESIDLPEFFITEILKDLTEHESHGTKFVIFDPSYQLLELEKADNDEFKTDRAVQHIRASLNGIYNAFKYKYDDAPFKTSFNIYLPNGSYDFIAKEEFFEPNDFELGDFLFDVNIDEDGFFEGKIRIYDKTVNYKRRISNKKAYTSYGPFKLKFGYLPGIRNESRLSDEQYSILDTKLFNYGSLYIYRDGFRVLPYGLYEYDFLHFEERRSRRAGEYFFSHRRMFGYIEVTRKNNPNLKDKAGREGFIRNQAYRDFQQDLITFFVDVAKIYLKKSTDEDSPSLREQQLEKITAANEAIKLENEKDKLERKEFARKLNENQNLLDQMKADFQNIYKRLERFTENSNVVYEDIETLLNNYENKKITFKNLKISKPKRSEITANQKNKFSYYTDDYNEVKNDIINKCDKLVEEIQKLFSDEELKKDFKAKYEIYKENLLSIFASYKHEYNDALKRLSENFNEQSWKFEKEFSDRTQGLIPYGNVTKTEIKNNLRIVKDIYEDIKDNIKSMYEPFIEHLEKIDLSLDEDLLVGYYKSQYKEIENKVESMQELAQLGMAIEIIDHEFNVLYAQMRNAVKYFQKYVNGNQETNNKYDQLKSSFDTLENNHKLLVPLYRTTRRTRTEITGINIEDYLKTFFDKQFVEKNIKFNTSKSFKNYIFYTYESIIQPVFINLINNAIYWLTPNDDREIFIDYQEKKILIMNSGEKIEPAYLEEIFDLFFTRKPSGRGIGLYLVRTNLRAIGYDIYATNEKKYNRLNGACFIIEEIKKK